MTFGVPVLLGKNRISFQLQRQVTQDKLICNARFIDIFDLINQILLTSECHHLSTNTCSSYVQKLTFQDHCMEHKLFFFLSRQFPSSIIISP